MLDKQGVYTFLKEHDVSFTATEHEAVFSMEALISTEIPHPEADAKNLFIRDDKKRNYYLITVRGNKRVNLKEFRRTHGLRNLSFASAEDLQDLLGLAPGSVSPFGLLNDTNHKVQFYLDEAFADGLIGIHPNDNTATVLLKTDDLIRVIEAEGHPVHIVKI